MDSNNDVFSVVKKYIHSDPFIRDNQKYQFFLLRVARIADSEFGIPPVDELAKVLGMKTKDANDCVVDLKSRNAWPFVTIRCVGITNFYVKKGNEELRVKAARLAKTRNLGKIITDEDIEECINSLESLDTCDMHPNLS